MLSFTEVVFIHFSLNPCSNLMRKMAARKCNARNGACEPRAEPSTASFHIQLLNVSSVPQHPPGISIRSYRTPQSGHGCQSKEDRGGPGTKAPGCYMAGRPSPAATNDSGCSSLMPREFMSLPMLPRTLYNSLQSSVS